MANQNVLDLRDVAAKSRELAEGQVVTVEGWVRETTASRSSIGFIEFYARNGARAEMQIVYDDQAEDFAAVQAIRNGAAVRATGKLVPGRDGALEMPAEQEISFLEEERLRGGLSAPAQAPHARVPARHRVFVARARACFRRMLFASAPSRRRRCTTTSRAAVYVYVHTPLITANDAEGAGNTFTVTNQEMGRPLPGGERISSAGRPRWP